ncbi:MAG: patatin-like phospholipase family protein [Bacteroidota bacterium]
MRKALRSIYFFLPVQLLFLHFRRYQMLLIFWVIIFATVTGNFASHFGASSLFLSPEYLGDVNFLSMMLLGGAMTVFIMAWHITTFIIHSHRIPFLGATRQSFLKYCLNNSLLPLGILIFYSIISARFQVNNEHAGFKEIFLLQAGFYVGATCVTFLSFIYFFRVGRDMLKTVITHITNPAMIRGFIPYDTLDIELDIIHAETYLSETMKIESIKELESYHPRFLNTVLRRHHRNAIAATLFAFSFLVVLGIFMEQPLLRIPAGAGFLILFSVMMGLVGAVKYFLRSWEIIGWGLFLIMMSVAVKERVFDLRSIAYGVNYHTTSEQQPIYSYTNLRKIFSPERYEADKKYGTERLENWKNKRGIAGDTNPPLIVVNISGGGTRSAYWTFRTLQHLDSMTHGRIFSNTVLITGASGGMLGAAYWRSIHDAYAEKTLINPYDGQYQANIGKDLLNSIIFSMASVDLVSPIDRVSVGGYSYPKDRGYAMEQELIVNTQGLLDKKLDYYRKKEYEAEVPAMIINGTIVNDGRKLMMSAQPVGYLTQPEYSLKDTGATAIDAVDFATFFHDQNPYNLRIASALRMNATFPYILPVVKLPSIPQMNIMDAGLIDNFGTELASRYIYVYRDWILKNTKDVIFLEIRDTKESELFPPSDQNSLSKMMIDPLMVIQNKWESIQSYNHCYLKEYAPYFLEGKMHFITFQYIPEEERAYAELNFHLTQKEKLDIYQSIDKPQNKKAIETLLQLLQ